VRSGLLQRKCACGGTPGPTGECEECRKKRLSLQAKLKVNRPGDTYEHEADTIADRVMSTRPQYAVTGAPMHIQRFAEQSHGQFDAPASVDQALASVGSPLEPAVRQDMEQRFGHDFSRVRVHSDPTAELSAREVNANAYTVGRNIVFGAGRFAPGTHEGRRLIAHELTHVVQQAGADGMRDSRIDEQRGLCPIPQASTSTFAAGSVIRSTNSHDIAGLIQRQATAVAPTARKKIKKIILDKKQGVEVLVLEDNSTETIRLLDHCDPKAGDYTAQVKNSPQRSEKLDFVTDQAVGCAVDKGYIAKTATARKVGTLEGVESIEFQVRDDQAGTATGETKVGFGASGQDIGNEQGAPQKETQPAPALRSVKEIWSEITALPKHVREFLIAPKYGRALKAEEYEIVLRIGKKLESAGVSPDELFEYEKATGSVRSFTLFEANIDSFLFERLTKQEEREQNITEREKAETKLFGVEALFKKYDVYERLRRSNFDSPELREELNKNLPHYGFANIAEFEQAIRDYEAAFENETLAIAFDLLLKYEHILHREYEQFAPGKTGGTSEATKTLQSLGKVRAPAQALYGQASEETLKALEHKSFAFHASGKEEEALLAKGKASQQEATKHKKEAEEMVKGAVSVHSIVGWQDFPREKLLSRTTAEDVRYEIAFYISEHEAAVQRARNLLKEKPKRVYELDNLLDVSYAAQGIEKDSIQDLIIRSRIDQIESDKTAKEILIAIIAVALAIASLGGGTIGLLAAGAAFGISTAQAVSAIEQYETETALYLAQLLSDYPSAAWAIIAVIGAGIDATAVIQAAVKVVVPAAKAFNQSQNILELENSLAGVEKRIRANVLKAAGAERELKTAVEQFKGSLTSPGGKLRGVGVPGGELFGHLVAITYYYIKSRVLRFTFRGFLRQLEKEGLIEIAKLSPDDLTAFKRAFQEATELSRAGQLPYGKQIYGKLSERARTAFPPEAVDRFVAQGKALGKSDKEIIDTLEAEAHREKLLEGAGEQKILAPDASKTEEELKELGGYQHAFEGPLGDIVSDPVEAGNQFNKVNVPEGAHAEVQLHTPSGRRPRVDLWVKGEAIISRKFPMGQLAQDELKALDYLQELYTKYPPRAPILSSALKGEILEGIQVLQIPVQYLPIPEQVLKYARDRHIVICDIDGHVYDP
jgi:hypothetical protein